MEKELQALKGRLFGVGGVRNVKLFPGLLADAEPNDVARQMNKFFVDAPDADAHCE